jgi:uncharacterized protein YuzE
VEFHPAADHVCAVEYHPAADHLEAVEFHSAADHVCAVEYYSAADHVCAVEYYSAADHVCAVEQSWADTLAVERSGAHDLDTVLVPRVASGLHPCQPQPGCQPQRWPRIRRRRLVAVTLGAVGRLAATDS